MQKSRVLSSENTCNLYFPDFHLERVKLECQGVLRMGSAYRVLDRRAKKGFLLRWTFVLCSVSFALLVQSDSSNAKVGRDVH